MDEREWLAAAAQHDAQALAATGGGRATTNQQEFLDWLDQAAARHAIRDADTRTVEQIAADLGVLHQQWFDANWYGTPEQSATTALAYLQAEQHPSISRLYVHAAAVQVGDHVRVRGHAVDGEPDGATGVVQRVDYTERFVDPFGFGEYDSHYGFAFTILPVVPAGERDSVEAEEIWVRETGSPEVLRLPMPVDRGRQSWLDEPYGPTPERGPVSLAGLSFDNDADTSRNDAPGAEQANEPPRYGRPRER